MSEDSAGRRWLSLRRREWLGQPAKKGGGAPGGRAEEAERGRPGVPRGANGRGAAGRGAQSAGAPTRPDAEALAQKDRGRPARETRAEPGQTAALCGIRRRRSWRHRFCAPRSDKPRGLRGIVEADETFVPNPQGPTVRPAEKGAKARRNGQAPGLPHTSPSSSPATATAPPDAISAQVDGAGEPRPRRNRHAGQHLIGDGGKAIATFARRAGIAFHTVPSPGSRPAAPHLHINNVNAYHGRLKQWLNRSTASPPRTCQLSRLAAR